MADDQIDSEHSADPIKKPRSVAGGAVYRWKGRTTEGLSGRVSFQTQIRLAL